MKTIEGFTPGPWEVVDQDASVWADGQQVAQTAASPGVGMRIHWNMDKRRANAALIAQAPTLYAENERLRARMEKLEKVGKALYVLALGHHAETEAYMAEARAALSEGGGA